jgi:hypothetical protein
MSRRLIEHSASTFVIDRTTGRYVAVFPPGTDEQRMLDE